MTGPQRAMQGSHAQGSHVGPKSRVRLPREVRGSYEVREGVLVFERELRKDRISGWRWLLGAWGVGTYRQNDSVDVRYEAADGSPRVAEGLEIEAV